MIEYVAKLVGTAVRIHKGSFTNPKCYSFCLSPKGGWVIGVGWLEKSCSISVLQPVVPGDLCCESSCDCHVPAVTRPVVSTRLPDKWLLTLVGTGFLVFYIKHKTGGTLHRDDSGHFVLVKFTEVSWCLEKIQDFRELWQIGFIFSSHDLIPFPLLKFI